MGGTDFSLTILFYYCLNCDFWHALVTHANRHLRENPTHAISRVDLDQTFKSFSHDMLAKFLQAMQKDDRRSPVPWVTYTRESMEDRLKDEWTEFWEGQDGQLPKERSELLDIANFCLVLYNMEAE